MAAARKGIHVVQGPDYGPTAQAFRREGRIVHAACPVQIDDVKILKKRCLRRVATHLRQGKIFASGGYVGVSRKRPLTFCAALFKTGQLDRG